MSEMNHTEVLESLETVIGLCREHESPSPIEYNALNQAITDERKIADGKFVELPCKVGDALFVPCSEKEILETKVTGFQCQLGAWIIFTENYNEHNIRNCHWFRFEWINKEFFLTRAEAETSLSEKKG